MWAYNGREPSIEPKRGPIVRAWTTKVHVSTWEDGGFKAEVPSLQGCWVVAPTAEEAFRDIYEVLEMSIASRLKRGESLPVDVEPIVTKDHGPIELDVAVVVR